MEPIKVALAGFGPGGRVYNAPIIASVKELEVRSILTTSPENIKNAEEDFPSASIVGEYSEILSDSEIELVVITVPNQHHADFTERALKAGKHVVVEKPFTPTVKQSEALTALAAENNLILSINHNRRWDSDIRTIKKLLEQGRLGKVVEYEAHFDRFRPEVKVRWKDDPDVPGNGLLYDLGSHLIDQALWLFGIPKEIFADLRAQRKGSEVVDSFEVLLFYPELKVTLKAGMMIKDPGPKYQVFGRKGSFTKWGMDVQEPALLEGQKPSEDPNWGIEPKEIWGRINTLDEEGLVESERGDYREFYRNIAKSIRGTENLLVTPEQASTVVNLIEMAIRSSNEKRVIPVNLENPYNNTHTADQ